MQIFIVQKKCIKWKHMKLLPVVNYMDGGGEDFFIILFFK